MGFKILIAGNAENAIAQLDADPSIDAMVTDVDMPGTMDGVKLAHHVRNRWPSVKIIVTSGSAREIIGALPRESIAFEKPYSPERLRDVFIPPLSQANI